MSPVATNRAVVAPIRSVGRSDAAWNVEDALASSGRDTCPSPLRRRAQWFLLDQRLRDRHRHRARQAELREDLLAEHLDELVLVPPHVVEVDLVEAHVDVVLDVLDLLFELVRDLATVGEVLRPD